MAGVVAAVAIGSSLGDRQAHIAFAQAQLTPLLGGMRFSRTIETAPVDVPGEQTPFLNAAAVGTSSLEARALLAALHAIEDARGRTRPYRNAPRTLDLDLILYGDLVLDSPDLVLPHPRFRERAFVLEPLVEIGADLCDPVTHRTVASLYAALRR
ncbi:MAG: 2-amino-4-hydroxy-6-hydroxymethyldihydropteridine diphosphokinase [Vicinamibacterales bacterium]